MKKLVEYSSEMKKVNDALGALEYAIVCQDKNLESQEHMKFWMKKAQRHLHDVITDYENK